MSMRARSWSFLFVACLAIGIAAFATRMVFVPDAYPIALADEPLAFWAFELALLLRALELTASFGAILLIIAGLGALIYPHSDACPAESTAHRGRL